MFPNVDGNALIDVWPTIRNKPNLLFGTEIDEDVLLPTEDTDVRCFVHLLKFLPAKRVKLKNAVKSLIKFCTVSNFYAMFI